MSTLCLSGPQEIRTENSEDWQIFSPLAIPRFSHPIKMKSETEFYVKCYKSNRQRTIQIIN
jgi:hypothetical protein